VIETLFTPQNPMINTIQKPADPSKGTNTILTDCRIYVILLTGGSWKTIYCM